MLTLVYCRVSTEEQAEEGYSIEGQADKLRAYAALRDFGPVTVVSDRGLSGKNLDRPGLQQLLSAVRAGHVAHVLVWRLDRLSRNLGDLILLADQLGELGVALHSVSENLDLSSASGRMFYNILGTFAQYFREQLAENVRMGNARAVREGKWINRPKTGYDLIDGELTPNDEAVRVREIFHLRAKNMSYRSIADVTGLNYSTICSILNSRIYLGEVLQNGEWFPGRHEAILSDEEFRAAHRALTKGVKPTKDLLTGRVRCGICHRRMAVQQNGQGGTFYKCWHRGEGCDQGARSTKGLTRAAVLGLHLIGHDESLHEAVRRMLRADLKSNALTSAKKQPTTTARTLKDVGEKRRKLLELYYAGAITPDGFKVEEERLLAATAAASRDDQLASEKTVARDELAAKFDQIVEIIRNLNIDEIWMTATEEERRVLIEELVESVTVFPSHFEISVYGAPTLKVLPGEVGMKQSGFVGVGDGT